jgi:glycosyltransferase involved in cell wall biosynthesis
LVALDPVARAQALKAGFAKELISVLPYGVDVARFRPGLTSTLVARHRIRGRILLYVGRLLPNRGLELFVSAFARTVGQRSDWNLVLAGEGSSKGELRAMVDRLGIADRTHFLARPRREELPGLLGASTLLAIPSLDGDVVGWQIGRALACGLPVLASDLPRLRTHLAHEETGLLVRPGDADAWAEAIQRAAGSPAARARWARQGRGVAERDLSWSAVGAGFESVILAARQAVRADAPSADAVARVEGETS